VLDDLATAIDSGQGAIDANAPLQRIEDAANALRHAQPVADPARRVDLATALRHLDALGGQLRAALEIAAQGDSGEEAI
jgi:D-alanyl-D-alanine carboxypeptidase